MKKVTVLAVCDNKQKTKKTKSFYYDQIWYSSDKIKIIKIVKHLYSYLKYKFKRLWTQKNIYQCNKRIILYSLLLLNFNILS